MRRERRAFTKITVPMIAKKIPLYHLRRPSANTRIINASTKQSIPETKATLLNLFSLIASPTVLSAILLGDHDANPQRKRDGIDSFVWVLLPF